MATTPLFIASEKLDGAQIIAAHGTNPRKIWTPGSNGSKITKINIASSDAVANEVILWRGKALTLQANMGAGAFVDGGGGSDTITRSTGSFLTDGFLVNSRILPYGATTLGNDFLATLTAVAALTLTFATATVDTAEAFPSGSEIFELSKLGIITVGANAGSVAGTPAVDGLDPDEMPALNPAPNRALSLGSTDILFASVTTLMGSDEQMDIVVEGGDY